jgi:hypothetical protein
VSIRMVLSESELGWICDALSELVDPYGWDDPEHAEVYELIHRFEKAHRQAKKRREPKPQDDAQDIFDGTATGYYPEEERRARANLAGIGDHVERGWH